jgi:hypothetical protein
MTLTAHEAIIELGKRLGYIDTLVNIDRGLCAGISALWMKARLVHQDDRFNARIQRIIDETDTLAEQIEAVKRKVKAKEILSADDSNLLEILAFYDGIALHQSPDVFSETLGSSYRQKEMVKISDFSQSLALEASGGLREIHSQANVYSVTEISAYFKALADMLNSIAPPLTEPIGFVLSSHNHSISLCYDVTAKLWTFMDINWWPSKSMKHEVLLATHIRRSIGFKSSKDEGRSCFNVQVFAKGEGVAPDLFDVFEEEHRIQPEKIRELDAESLKVMLDSDENLGVIIAEIAKLARGFELLSTPDSSGYAPAAAAAEIGRVSVIAEIAKLAQGFELLSMASSDGYSPATLAALHGHVSVIAEMAKLARGYELLSTPDNNGYTAAYIAAYNGQVSVIAELAKLAQGYELLNTAGRDGYTPASTAVENGDVAVIEEIAHLPYGLELLKSVNIDKLSALPSLMAKKCAANILLEEIDRLSITHAPEDKIMFIEQQQMQLSEATASTMDEMIEKLKRHLYAVKELNECIKRIQEGGLFDSALKREKAKSIELALISIPLNQRDSILLQDTSEKRNLCRILDLHFPSWRKKAGAEVDEGSLPDIEESGSGFFKEFK